MDEVPNVIGFLGDDGVLYCGRACAGARGQAGREVDEDEYESLLEGRKLAPVTACPACGAEFAVEWPEEERA